MSVINYSFLVGIVAMIVMWLLYAVLTKTWNPAKLFEGADGRASISKFQWWIWIMAIVFAYITIYAARSIAQGDIADPIKNIPGNVLAVLGFSTLTTTIAKGVTQSYAAGGLVVKSPASPAGSNKAESLVRDDSGIPDPYKLQLFLWTFIAIFIYMAKLVSIVTAAAAVEDSAVAIELLEKFPDIDRSLMILSGISATGYIGKKIVTRDAPKISSVTPGRAQAGADLSIVVLGRHFCPEKAGSMLNIGSALDRPVTSWNNNEIRAAIPSTFPKGVHQISVIVAQVKSNEVTIELT